LSSLLDEFRGDVGALGSRGSDGEAPASGAAAELGDVEEGDAGYSDRGNPSAGDPSAGNPGAGNLDPGGASPVGFESAHTSLTFARRFVAARASPGNGCATMPDSTSFLPFIPAVAKMPLDRRPRPFGGARCASRSKPAAARRGALRAAHLLGACLLLATFACFNPARAQTPAAVVPDVLARFVPDTWHGIDASERKARFDASGAAMASAHYDDTEDQRASSDLSLAITDLGPYRAATRLVYRADVEEGRAERLDIGGYPAFAAVDYGDPTLDVFAGRMWIRSRAFGDLFSAADLRRAVAALPLDAIAALSDAPVADRANYRPLGFTAGVFRHFLPETVLGLPKGDGYYAKRHPTGVAWGGLPYSGTHAGHDARVRVTIWDLGTLADASRRRLARQSDTWKPFEEGGLPGFVELNTPTPRVLLFDRRFRVQVDAPGQPGMDTAWLRGAFADIDLERLAHLADLVPAPTPALDPLFGQPELVAPEALARALPDAVAGLARRDLRSEVSSNRSEPFDTAYAQARYQEGDSGPTLTVTVFDQGIVPLQVKERLADMRAVEDAGRTVHVSDERSTVLVTVGDRLVVTVEGRDAAGSGVEAGTLLNALHGVDLDALATLVGGSSRD